MSHLIPYSVENLLINGMLANNNSENKQVWLTKFSETVIYLDENLVNSINRCSNIYSIFNSASIRLSLPSKPSGKSIIGLYIYESMFCIFVRFKIYMVFLTINRITKAAIVLYAQLLSNWQELKESGIKWSNLLPQLYNKGEINWLHFS